MIQDVWRPSEGRCAELLRELVQTDTCQPEGKEETLVDKIISRLPDGISYTKLEHGQGRASLIVEIKREPEDKALSEGKAQEENALLEGKAQEENVLSEGKAQAEENALSEERQENGALAFIGHLDTVACGRAEEWKYPPLEGHLEDGIMYGRGTADMKGGAAAMFLALERLWEERHLLERDVYFCFTADEEYKGIGIQAMAQGGYLSDVKEVVICEPSDEQVSICEKGALWLSVQIKGVGAHASRPELGVNAAETAYAFAGRMKQYMAAAPEHPILGKASASVTKIESGIMTNMIPAEAALTLDIRTVPGISCEEVEQYARETGKALEEEYPGLRLCIGILNCRPAVGTGEGEGLVRRMLKLAGEMGMSETPRGTYFYTDASQLIPMLPVPFVIAGPGDDRLAHCTDEHVEVESVERFAEMYWRYAVLSSGGAMP